MTLTPVRAVSDDSKIEFELACQYFIERGYRITSTACNGGDYRAIFALPAATMIPQLTRLFELSNSTEEA
jgi:hypothetical protein